MLEWVMVTANVQNGNSPSQGILLVGGTGGVYRTLNAGTSSVWNELGSGLPNAVVMDLEYVASNDQLLVGTLGRSVWSLQTASAQLNQNPTLQITGTAGRL